MFFKKFLGEALGAIMILESSSATEMREPLSPTSTQLALFSLKMFSCAILDSLRIGKPSEVFSFAMGNKAALKTCFSVVSSIDDPSQKEYFETLSRIFSKAYLEITDNSAQKIYTLASNGNEDAKAMLIAALGKTTFEEVRTIEKEDAISALEESMQSVCSSSDSDLEEKSELTLSSDEQENSFYDSELLQDPLYVAGTVCNLADSISSFCSEESKEKDLIRHYFNFLVRAKYDRKQLFAYIEDIRLKDNDLADELNKLLK